MSFSKHSAVISAFGQHFAKAGLLPADLHRFVLDAQKNRQAGDYGSKWPVTRELAQQDVDHTEQFLQAARSHLATQHVSKQN